MSEKERIDAQVDDCATDTYDRGVARAILNQARQRGGVTDVQVAHLLAIGFRSGYRAGLTDARPVVAKRRRWWGKP